MTSASAIFFLYFPIFVVTAFDPRNGVIMRDDPTHLIIALDGVVVAAVLHDCRVVDLTHQSTGVILSETDEPNHFILRKNGQNLLIMVLTGSGKCLIKVESERVAIRPAENYSLRYQSPSSASC